MIIYDAMRSAKSNRKHVQQELFRHGGKRRAARNINTALGDGVRRRRGKVFADRYHVEVIRSRTQAHHTLRYVLLNWRRHREDQRGLPSTWLVDPFSTGVLF